MLHVHVQLSKTDKLLVVAMITGVSTILSALLTIPVLGSTYRYVELSYTPLL